MWCWWYTSHSDPSSDSSSAWIGATLRFGLHIHGAPLVHTQEYQYQQLMVTYSINGYIIIVLPASRSSCTPSVQRLFRFVHRYTVFGWPWHAFQSRKKHTFPSALHLHQTVQLGLQTSRRWVSIVRAALLAHLGSNLGSNSMCESRAAPQPPCCWTALEA